jgi:hypothetical protein
MVVGNGLFAVDGINVAELVAEHLGPRMLPAVLYKPGASAVRDPAHPTRAPAPGAPTAHPCRGFIENFKPDDIDGTLIKVGDRKVTLIAGTIQGGVEPEGGVNKDQVEIEDKRWDVWLVLDRDPAAATYQLQVRNT